MKPTVRAIMLTADRPSLARRAVESFKAQTYPNKHLLIWDTGRELMPEFESEGEDGIYWIAADRNRGLSIGELRNLAISFWTDFPIIVHWDSDDWSHPNRITEQVSLLQSSGAEAVGYNEMLFWREPSRIDQTVKIGERSFGEAWLFSNPIPSYALGTSLCYWRKTWERRPFAAISQGEDQDWIDGVASGRGPGVKLWSVSSFPGEPQATAKRLGMPDGRTVMKYDIDAPRMIARIHGKNTSVAYDPALMRASQIQGSGWKRAPEWDSYCRGICE